MSERNIFEGIGETVEFEIENTDALKELFNKTKEESLKIQKRFADGTYTEDDLLNHLPRFGLGTKDKIEMYVVESKYFEDLANRYINLKEIEKSHKEENGKLRVELEQYKLLEANIDKANKIIAENKFDEGLYGLLMQEKEKNKELEEKLKISVAILTKGTYPEENEGDNDFDKQFIAVDKIKEKIEETNSEKLNYSEDEYYLENEVKGYAIDKLKELLGEK